MAVVLDASAILAFLNKEPGGELVAAALTDGAFISAVNWAEVLTRVAELGAQPEQIAERFRAQGILGATLHLQPLTEEDCLEIARLRAVTRHLGMGLGDRACLALGKWHNLPVMTADKQWATLNIGVAIHLIR